VEDVFGEPREELSLGGLLHGSHDSLPNPFVFLVMAHDRRRILHFAVTQHPTAEWTAHQLREAFPWDTAPRFLLRDRDRIFGHEFMQQLKAMDIKQVLSTPNAPRQRAYIERLIGTIRRECLDHVIVFNESSLRRHLLAFSDYYHRSRTHLSLQKDTPDKRPIQPTNECWQDCGDPRGRWAASSLRTSRRVRDWLEKTLLPVESKNANALIGNAA
jgi:Integrase core domain